MKIIPVKKFEAKVISMTYTAGDPAHQPHGPSDPECFSITVGGVNTPVV
jgi:hypothetical protein